MYRHVFAAYFLLLQNSYLTVVPTVTLQYLYWLPMIMEAMSFWSWLRSLLFVFGCAKYSIFTLFFT